MANSQAANHRHPIRLCCSIRIFCGLIAWVSGSKIPSLGVFSESGVSTVPLRQKWYSRGRVRFMNVANVPCGIATEGLPAGFRVKPAALESDFNFNDPP